MSKDCEDSWGGPQSVALFVSAVLNAGFAIGLAWKCSRKRKENKHEVRASNEVTQNADGSSFEKREVTATIWVYEDRTDSKGKVTAGKQGGAMKRVNKKDRADEDAKSEVDISPNPEGSLAVADAIRSARKAANSDTDMQREAAFINLVGVVRSHKPIAAPKKPDSPREETSIVPKPKETVVPEAKPKAARDEDSMEEAQTKSQLDPFSKSRNANGQNLATSSTSSDSGANMPIDKTDTVSAPAPKVTDIFAAIRGAKATTNSEASRQVPPPVEQISPRDVHQSEITDEDDRDVAIDIAPAAFAQSSHIDPDIEDAISRRDSIDLMLALSTPHHSSHVDEDDREVSGLAHDIA